MKDKVVQIMKDYTCWPRGLLESCDFDKVAGEIDDLYSQNQPASIEELKLTVAAYKLALEWDYVPDPDEAVSYPDEYHTTISRDDYYKAAEKYGGWGSSELSDRITVIAEKLVTQTKEAESES